MTRTKSAIKRKEQPKTVVNPKATKSRLIKKTGNNTRKNQTKKVQRKRNNGKTRKNVTKSSKSLIAPSHSVPASVIVPASSPVVISTGKSKIAPKVRTESKLSTINKTSKVAQLSKSKSKDLQIPAFGFIDVCFCIDSTGSMSGELAQVQEVIKSIISNI